MTTSILSIVVPTALAREFIRWMEDSGHFLFQEYLIHEGVIDTERMLVTTDRTAILLTLQESSGAKGIDCDTR